MEKVFTRIFPIARNKNNEGILIEGMKLGIKKILTSYIDVSTFFYQLEEVILVLSQFNVKDVMKFLLEMFFKKGELNYGKEPDNFFNKYIVKFNDSKLLSLLLNVAIKVSDFEWVKLLLNNMKLKSTININEKDRNNEYPIFVALNHVTRYNDHIDIFNYLIELGADITVTDKFGITLLEVAIRNKKYKAVHYLLKHGIINYEINKNYSPMVNAIYQNDINTVTTILAKKTKNSKDDSPPTKKIRYQYDKYEYPPLVMAYLLHRDEIFKKLLECSDINLNELDINGCSLLHYVILKEDIETLHTLIKRGVRMDYQENDRCIGHYLSDIVLSIGNKEILSIILSSNNKNQIIHELNEYDETPLITLLKINTNLMDSNFKIDIFKYLVDCGASMEVKERNDRPLFYCVLDLASTEEENALLIVQYMIDQKYDIKNIMDETYLSPLNCAIEKGSFALMRLLLDNGADCFCWRTERNSISSLAFAISNGYIEPTKYLIQYLNEKNKSLQRYTGVSKISLINSIENPKTRITMLEYFLKSGLISLKHLKPSRVIQMVKHYDTMEETYDLFFKHGLDINFVDGIDGTLITNAIEESKDALLDYFLKKKINLSLYCYNSQFIEYIIKKNHFKIFKQLIQRKLPYSQIGLIVLAIKLKNFPISKYLIQRMNNMNETDKETILFYITKHKENRTFYYRMYKLLNNQYKKCLKRYE
ncbi:ankyrin [Piromyces finnis]|uniref:Ankyrin n=1 Tax=Piromyces finnis TaxID=1754191 RepID=A0A1Y1VNI2_9FUNG|nr:ankyrin [Piromyces finnis]|eukprot:ORX59930.1 ankyrin [Piromyces finnis]